MAYEIEFAPKPTEVMKGLAPELQHRIIHMLEAEAGTIEPEPGKTKKLRRTKVEDHRLVLLELHSNQRLMVLKIADPGEVFRRLKGEEKAFTATPPPPAIETPKKPALQEEPTAPPSGSEAAEQEDAGHEPETATDTPEEATAEEGSTSGAEASDDSRTGTDSSMLRLKREFLEQVIHKGQLFIVPDPDAMEMKRWGVRLAGSGGAFGYRYVSEMGQELSQIDVGKVEELTAAVNKVLDFAQSELSRLGG